MLPLINNEKSIYKDFYEKNLNDKIDHKKIKENKIVNKNENERIRKSKEEKK